LVRDLHPPENPMPQGITFAGLHAWIGVETDRSETWFARQPEAPWSALVGGRNPTVGDLLAHAYAVDVRLAQRQRATAGGRRGGGGRGRRRAVRAGPSWAPPGDASDSASSLRSTAC
jgi:hypothetical protein